MWRDVQFVDRKFNTHFLHFHMGLSGCLGNTYVCFTSIIIKCLAYHCSKFLLMANWSWKMSVKIRSYHSSHLYEALKFCPWYIFTCFYLLCAVFQLKPCQISVYLNVMTMEIIQISESCFQDKPSIQLRWPVFSTDRGNGQIHSVQDTHLWSPLQQTVGVSDQLS